MNNRGGERQTSSRKLASKGVLLFPKPLPTTPVVEGDSSGLFSYCQNLFRLGHQVIQQISVLLISCNYHPFRGISPMPELASIRWRAQRAEQI
jgi:hypothetical protein